MPFTKECFISSCPSEVFLLIAHYLHTPDLAYLAQTNHALYNLLIPVLWSHIYYKPTSSSSWYLNAQEIFEEEFLGLESTQRPAAYNTIREISRQQPSNLEALSSLSMASGEESSISSSSTDISSLISDEDNTTTSLFSHISLPEAKHSSSTIDKLSLALIQNKVSPLAKASIKSLIISTDYRFGHHDKCIVPLDPSKSISISFVQFLKDYLLTKETVPHLQYLRITHANPGHLKSRCKHHNSNLDANLEPQHASEIKRLRDMADVFGNFLNHHNVRLSLDSAMLYPVQAILQASPEAHKCLRFLHVEVHQTPTQHQILAGVLEQLPNLEVLSIKTREPKLQRHERFDYESDFDFSDDVFDSELASDDETDSELEFSDDEDTKSTLSQVDTELLKSSCKKLVNLKTLILKATSLIEAFSPDFLPPNVTHLELDSNYNNAHNTPSSSSHLHSSMNQFTNLWSQIFSHDLSQLTTLNISLWNTELFSSLPPQFFALPRPPAAILPHHGGNLQDIHIEGDYVPPGLDALIFASNPHLKRVKIPIMYGPGAHALAEHCHDTLEELTVFGIKNSFYHPPDFLDFRLLPLLARCRQLKSLYFHVPAKSLHGFDVLHMLAPTKRAGRLQLQLEQDDSSTLVLPSALTQVTIEQTDFDLPHYKEVIDEEEYEEYGGFGMLPLELIKQRLPLYNSIRTKFAPAEGDLSGIQDCLRPIDGDESTHCDPQYKQYYSTLAYTRYNCIFTLDIQKFLARNAFLFEPSPPVPAGSS